MSAKGYERIIREILRRSGNFKEDNNDMLWYKCQFGIYYPYQKYKMMHKKYEYMFF